MLNDVHALSSTAELSFHILPYLLYVFGDAPNSSFSLIADLSFSPCRICLIFFIMYLLCFFGDAPNCALSSTGELSFHDLPDLL